MTFVLKNTCFEFQILGITAPWCCHYWVLAPFESWQCNLVFSLLGVHTMWEILSRSGRTKTDQKIRINIWVWVWCLNCLLATKAAALLHLRRWGRGVTRQLGWHQEGWPIRWGEFACQWGHMISGLVQKKLTFRICHFWHFTPIYADCGQSPPKK